MINRPFYRCKSLHYNLTGQELELLVFIRKFSWLVVHQIINLLLAQVLYGFFSPLTAHFNAHPVIEVLD